MRKIGKSGGIHYYLIIRLREMDESGDFKILRCKELRSTSQKGKCKEMNGTKGVYS